MNRAIIVATGTIISHRVLPSLSSSLVCSFIAAPVIRLSTCKVHRDRYISSYKNNMADTMIGNESIGAGTCYQIISLPSKDETDDKQWIRICFDDSDNTTLAKQTKANNNNAQMKEQSSITASNKSATTTLQQSIPESVLQYERQMRKVRAADRASKTDVNIRDHLRTVFQDEHIVVTNKPSGILCVPGVNKNRSLLDLVYEVYGDNDGSKNANNDKNNVQSSSSSTAEGPFPRDSMIAHRLDMVRSDIFHEKKFSPNIFYFLINICAYLILHVSRIPAVL